MKSGKKTIKVCHDPDPLYYTFTEPEFSQLCDKTRIPEKENTFFLLGILIPSILNIVGVDRTGQCTQNWLFFVNILLVIVTFVLAIFQGKEWYCKRSAYTVFVASIKDKPRVTMQISDDKIGYVQHPPKVI